MVKSYFFFLSFLFFSTASFSQTYCTATDKAKLMAFLEQYADSSLQKMSTGDLAVYVGKQLMGTKYVAHTLEQEGDEKLVINLSGLDCTTFLENVVVFTRLIKAQKVDFEHFQKELAALRYRGAVQGDYASRLHYFTDWIYDNQKEGRIQMLSTEIGASPYEKHVDFMSTHRDSYKQLADDKFFTEIKQREDSLNQRDFPLYYLPKGQVAAQEANIQSGDLLAITTNIKGLDVSHVGLALRQKGRLYMLHAGTKNMRVEITPEPLAVYLSKHKTQSGIIVSRLQAPKL